jgi:hypothetical protein
LPRSRGAEVRVERGRRRCWASGTSRFTSPILEAAERFWVDVMGYAVEWRPDPDNVYLHGARDNLALHRKAGPARAASTTSGSPSPRPGRGRVGGVPDLAERALKTQPKTHRDGSRSIFYFHGPEWHARPRSLHHSPMA